MKANARLEEDDHSTCRGLSCCWVTRLAPWLVITVVVCAYANALRNGFAYDDVPIVERNLVVDPARPWWEAWVEPYWPGSNTGDRLDLLYRPLTVQTYAWERRLFGADPLPCHVTNVMLHALVSVCVWSAARRLGLRGGPALAGAMLFAVHPIHVEAVANIVGRAELLSALGLMTALLAEDARLRLELSGRAGCMRWIALTVVAMVCAAGAIFSKESGAAVLAAIPAWRWWRLRSAGAGRRGFEPPDLSPVTSNLDDARNESAGPGLVSSVVIRAVVPMAMVVGLYLWVRYNVCVERLTVGGQRGGPGNFLREISGPVRWWSTAAVLGRYLALMAWPGRLLCDYSLNVIVPSPSILEPYALCGMAAVAGAMTVAWRSARRSGRAAMLLVVFAASYLIPSNVVFTPDVMFAERLFFSPSLWLCLLMALGLDQIIAYRPAGGWNTIRASCAAAAVAILAAMAMRTWARNPAWRDTTVLMESDLAAMAPGRRSVHVLANVAHHRLSSGAVGQAEALLLEAIRVYSDAAAFHAELAHVYVEQRRYAEATTAFQHALELSPQDADLARELQITRELAAGRNPYAERDELLARLLSAPDDPEALRAWARLNEMLDPQEALRTYRRLASLAPNDDAAQKTLAYAAFAAGANSEAAAAYARVLQHHPDDWEAHTNLAVLLMDRTDKSLFDPSSAVRHARLAARLNPTHWNVQVNLAEVLANCGHEKEAADLFDALAQQSAPDSTERRMYAGRAAALRGR